MKDRRVKRIPLWLILVCAAALLGGGGATYGAAAHNAAVRTMEDAVEVDTYYPGTSVGGVDVGGLNREEARLKVGQALRDQYGDPGITIAYNEKQWVFALYELIDMREMDIALDAAWAENREGELADRYQGVLKLQEDGKDFPIEIVFTVDAVADGFASIAGEVDVPAMDARIICEPDTGFVCAEAQAGCKTDEIATMAAVRRRVTDRDWGEVGLVVHPVEPVVCAGDLVIVDFATSIAGNTENRAHNVRLALSKLDGYVLGPGELFSFNEVVGNRTAANGFKPAPVINGDKALVMGIGGGTCQASTTTYNAALRAGMEIVERHHHSFPVGYIEKGLDATVSWGTQDVKFINPRDTPVYFHTYFENDTVHVSIWGEPFPCGGEIRCRAEVTGTVSPPAPAERADGSLAPGQSVNYVKSRAGYRVTAYKEYYENGELVESTVLHRDYYQPIRGIVLKGPDPVETIPVAAE